MDKTAVILRNAARKTFYEHIELAVPLPALCVFGVFLYFPFQDLHTSAPS